MKRESTLLFQNKLLSRVGKEVVNKTVAQATPVYSMSVFLLPHNSSDDLQKMMNSFYKDGDSVLHPSLFHVRFSKLDTVRIVTFLIRRRVRLDLFYLEEYYNAKVVLLKDIRWRIGKGNLRNVFNDPWINDGENFYVDTAPLEGCENMQVCYLIHSNEGYDARRILAMPLSRLPIDNSFMWQFTTNDRYSVKSEVGLASIHDSVDEFVAHMLIDQQDDLRRRVLGMLWGIWYSWNVLVWKPILSVGCVRGLRARRLCDVYFGYENFGCFQSFNFYWVGRDANKMLSVILVFMALLVVSCLHVYNNWFGSTGNSHGVEYCVVCLSKVSKGEKLRWLRCRHCFHVHCIDAWLKVGTTCPICRVNVAPKRNFIISSMVSLAKRVGQWIENPLSSELTVAFCESFGFM
ncbi:LINE-1 reverse transcriptase isogeny [Gossypium australe]|uniref:RING-type E3 ubiquitin transferase n=7 Tax=Gossypium TaxID=3633 RepID=A0A5B6WCX9_9ROSI|nr:LINE-1 reverse transcriptase isogeny [Gossypium australe]